MRIIVRAIPCARVFVAGSVMSIRNYFRPSNGLSKPTSCISVALKSREHAGNFKSALWQVRWIFLVPMTVHSIVAISPSQKQRTQPRYLSRQMSYDSSSFTATAYRSEAFSALFRTPTTLQPPPPILHHVRGSLEYNIPLRKNSSTAVTFSVRFFPLL